MKRKDGLTASERRALALLYPDKSVAIGLSVFADLRRKGLVEIDRRKWRYVLTSAGRAVVERPAQGEMRV